MSLFDTLIGSTGNASSNNNSTSDQTQAEQKNTSGQVDTSTSGSQVTNSNNVSNTNSNTNQSNASSAKGTNTTSTLDANTIAALSALIPGLAKSVADPNGGSAALTQQIAQQFLTKSQTPAISDQDIAGQQSAAVTSFNNNEAVDISKLQNSIGSKNNTYSALVAQKGQTDLASQLAGIVANAKSTNAQIGDTQLNDAINAIVAGAGIGNTNVGNLVSLISSLKGAQTTETTDQNIAGTTSQNTQAQTVAQILEILNNNQNVNQNSNTSEDTAAVASGASSSNTAGKQGSGLLGMLF